jgi:hypothetical protein
MFALSLPPDGPVTPCPVEIDSEMGDTCTRSSPRSKPPVS